jgi:hypothetical protein
VEFKIKLKNADAFVIVDKNVYDDFLIKDPHLVKLKFVETLRLHSSGCCVFQKLWTLPNKSGTRTETIYLHKLIAEHFLPNDEKSIKRVVGAKNGNKLDCRVENLVYRSRSIVSTLRMKGKKNSFIGVYFEKNKYKAMISLESRTLTIGYFDTAEEAALAYNEKSMEHYGKEGKFNIIHKKD